MLVNKGDSGNYSKNIIIFVGKYNDTHHAVNHYRMAMIN